MDCHNLDKTRTAKASRFSLHVLQGQGRAVSYSLHLHAKNGHVINKRYLGNFYEDEVQDIGRRLRCHVRTMMGDLDHYQLLNVSADAPWETFTTALKRKVSDVIDFNDKVIAGVRRISFTFKGSLVPVTIHVANV